MYFLFDATSAAEIIRYGRPIILSDGRPGWAVTAGAGSSPCSANSSGVRMLRRLLICSSVSEYSGRRSCSTFESVDSGMPQRTLISLSVQPLHARSERSRLPIVGCCEVIARGFLRFVRVDAVGNAGRFPARDDMLTPRARLCQRSAEWRVGKVCVRTGSLRW